MTEIQICFSYKLSIGVLLQQFFFLLLFLTLHYGMVKNVLSPDLTGKLPWPALMGQLQLPLSLQQGRIPQCQKLPCSRHCEVGYNCFTVGFGFVCLFVWWFWVWGFFSIKCRHCSKTGLLRCQMLGQGLLSRSAPVTCGLAVNPYGMLTACKYSQMEIISVTANVLI